MQWKLVVLLGMKFILIFLLICLDADDWKQEQFVVQANQNFSFL